MSEVHLYYLPWCAARHSACWHHSTLPEGLQVYTTRDIKQFAHTLGSDTDNTIADSTDPRCLFVRVPPL